MEKVLFITRDGKERPMKRKLAEHLAKAGKGEIKAGTYQTRQMVAAPAPVQQQLTPPADAIKATPAAKELAEKEVIDLATLQGTGADGAITVPDVRKALGETE